VNSALVSSDIVIPRNRAARTYANEKYARAEVSAAETIDRATIADCAMTLIADAIDMFNACICNNHVMTLARRVVTS